MAKGRPGQFLTPDATGASGGAGIGAVGGSVAGAASLGPWGAVGMVGFQLWSSFQQAEMIRQQAQLTEQINEMNAKFDELEAWEVEKGAHTRAARYQATVDATISQQREAYAAQNVDPNFGTALAIQEESRLTGLLNQLDIIEQGHRSAMGLRNQARNRRLGSYMGELQSEAAARGTVTQGFVGAGRTMLGYQGS